MLPQGGKCNENPIAERVASNHNVNGNGKPRNRIAPRGARHSTTHADHDVIYSMAIRLDILVRRLAPHLRTALIEETLLRRARTSIRVAEAADNPEDRVQPTLWQTGRAGVVHWEVAANSAVGFEDRAFAACGRQGAVSMKDARWEHGMEETHPVTCAHCKALLQAAKG
jgi:hypothetical protein